MDATITAIAVKNVQQSLWSYGKHTSASVAITALQNDRWRVLNVFFSSDRSDLMKTSR